MDILFASLVHLAALTAQPAAQPTLPPPAAHDDGRFTALTLMAENDVFFQLGHNEDRNYTGGFGAVASGSFVDRAKLNAPLRLLDWASRSGRMHGRWDHHYHSFQFFGTGFTPDQLNTAEVVQGDRPYASLVGFSVRKLSVDDSDLDEAWSSDFSLAMLGLDLPGEVQTSLHRRIRRGNGKPTPYDPLGWHNQISQGGELTALYRVAYERRLAGGQTGADVRKHFQLAGGGQASAGYYTNVGATMNARLGWFNSDFWEFTPNAMNVANQTLGTGRRHPNPRVEFFLFGGVRPRAVVYNALLQGQFKHSVYTVRPKRAVLEWDLGASLFVPFLRLQVVWNVYAGRTSEFHGNPERHHTWGSLMATYAVKIR